MGSSKASSTLSRKALHFVIENSRGVVERADVPKNREAPPTSSASMSITGPPAGPIVTIGISITTRSVNSRGTLALLCRSPVERIPTLGSIRARLLLYRRK